MICEPRATADNGRSPPKAVARSLGDLAHDMTELLELQSQLFRIEMQDSIKKITWPLITLAMAAVIALASLPILLTTFAFLLIEQAELSYTVSFLLAALLGFVLAGVLGAIGYFGLKSLGSPFSRSQAEVKRNVAWFREHLKPSIMAEVPPSQRF